MVSLVADEGDIKLDVKFLPDDQGEMRTVMLGAGEVGVLILPHAEDDGSVRLEIVTGGCDQEELANLLYMIAVTLNPSLEDEGDQPVPEED